MGKAVSGPQAGREGRQEKGVDAVLGGVKRGLGRVAKALPGGKPAKPARAGPPVRAPYQMRGRADLLQAGEIARLIPIDGDGAPEQRLTSAFLATVEAVPAFAQAVVRCLGGPAGSAEKTEAFREVVFADTASNRCPDGLLRILDRGKRWCALMEAKTGLFKPSENHLTQVRDYIAIADELNLDRLFTVSALAPEKPVRTEIEQAAWARYRPAPVPLTWLQLYAIAVNLLEKGRVRSDAEHRILEEFVRFLHFHAQERKQKGVLRLNSLGSDWPEYLTTLARKRGGGPDAGLEEAFLLAWRTGIVFASLHLCHRDRPANCTPVPKDQAVDPTLMRQKDKQNLTRQKRLEARVIAPGTETPIDVTLTLKKAVLEFALCPDLQRSAGEAKTLGEWVLPRLPTAEGVFDTHLDIRLKDEAKSETIGLDELQKAGPSALDKPPKAYGSVRLVRRYDVSHILPDPAAMLLLLITGLREIRVHGRRLIR
ncbi:MAG: hypothetical protein AAGH45_09400 [Pseudomonadota bacterium]